MPSPRLTILLTLKDRTEFTRRWMEYMNANLCQYPIIIADGGCDTDIEEHLKNKLNYSKLNYRYIRYAYDRNIRDFFVKLQSAINQVETDYIVLADNDDFFVTENFNKYIEFLDCNPTYVTCSGQSAHLSIFEHNTLTNSTSGDSYQLVCDRIQKNIEQDSPLKRIQFFFDNANKQNLWNKFYSITKTNVLRQTIKYFINSGDTDVNVFELYFNISLLYSGKHKEYPELYYIRQEGTSQLSIELENKGNLIERLILENSTQEFINLIEASPIGLSDDEKTEIKKYFVKWLISIGCQIYGAKPNSIKKFAIKLIARIKYINININSILLHYYKLRNYFSDRKIYSIKCQEILPYILKKK